MTQNEKNYVANLIRQETGCGLHDASAFFDTFLNGIKHRPLLQMDNPQKINITWESEREDNEEIDQCVNCIFNDTDCPGGSWCSYD